MAQTDDALDAIKMCDAAKSCRGFRKESILAEAIADLLWAFNPAAEFKYTGSREDLGKLYSDYLANANLILVATKKEQSLNNNNIKTLEQLNEALQDASKMRAAAKTCIGTRRLHIVAKADHHFNTAYDDYDRLYSVQGELCGEEQFCCCNCF